MKCDIRLYAHGVTVGQTMWGVPDEDFRYIESFYTPKRGEDDNMLVEVCRPRGSAYCYYTYLRVKDVVGNGGRNGSYFALTLRINYYYADIKNIYHILDAAFDKFVEGSIVSTANGVTKYLVGDMAQADKILTSLDAEIQKYLMQFSKDSDFIPLSGFNAFGNGETLKFNLLECDAKTAARTVGRIGSISVSPLYPTDWEKQISAKAGADVTAAQNEARQQIAATKQDAENRIRDIQGKAAKEVEAARRDKEEGIRAVREEFREAGKTISTLKQRVEKCQGEIQRLQQENQKFKYDLQSSKKYETDYAKMQAMLDEADARWQKLRDLFAPELGTAVNQPQPEPKHSNPFMALIAKFHPLVGFIVMIILILIISFTMLNRCASQSSAEQPNTANADGNVSVLPEKFNDYQIVVYPFDENGAIKFDELGDDALQINKKYSVMLKNGENLNGTWISPNKDFVISNSEIVPIKTGECTLEYVADGKSKVKRTFNVK